MADQGSTRRILGFGVRDLQNVEKVEKTRFWPNRSFPLPLVLNRQKVKKRRFLPFFMVIYAHLAMPKNQVFAIFDVLGVEIVIFDVLGTPLGTPLEGVGPRFDDRMDVNP